MNIAETKKMKFNSNGSKSRPASGRIKGFPDYQERVQFSHTSRRAIVPEKHIEFVCCKSYSSIGPQSQICQHRQPELGRGPRHSDSRVTGKYKIRLAVWMELLNEPFRETNRKAPDVPASRD